MVIVMYELTLTIVVVCTYDVMHLVNKYIIPFFVLHDIIIVVVILGASV